LKINIERGRRPRSFIEGRRGERRVRNRYTAGTRQTQTNQKFEKEEEKTNLLLFSRAASTSFLPHPEYTIHTLHYFYLTMDN
jgi:hypothetical protein